MMLNIFRVIECYEDTTISTSKSEDGSHSNNKQLGVRWLREILILVLVLSFLKYLFIASFLAPF